MKVSSLILEPPKHLVVMWISFARSNCASDELKQRASSMLREKVGKPEDIAIYMRKHEIM